MEQEKVNCILIIKNGICGSGFSTFAIYNEFGLDL